MSFHIAAKKRIVILIHRHVNLCATVCVLKKVEHTKFTRETREREREEKRMDNPQAKKRAALIFSTIAAQSESKPPRAAFNQ